MITTLSNIQSTVKIKGCSNIIHGSQMENAMHVDKITQQHAGVIIVSMKVHLVKYLILLDLLVLVIKTVQKLENLLFSFLDMHGEELSTGAEPLTTCAIICSSTKGHHANLGRSLQHTQHYGIC